MDPVNVYVIAYNNQYLCKACWGNRFNWSDDLVGAKLYVSEADTKKDLLKVSNAYSKANCYPTVLVFTMTWVQTIDQSERLKKNKESRESCSNS